MAIKRTCGSNPVESFYAGPAIPLETKPELRDIAPAKNVVPHNITNEGTDPEQCAGCGQIFVKNEMHRTPDGLMCTPCFEKSKYKA